MEACEQCGNTTPHWFVVEQNGARHVFDSFECAIYALAPACGHCGCRIVGHGFEGGTLPSPPGLEEEREVFCCKHCADKHQSELMASNP